MRSRARTKSSCVFTTSTYRFFKVSKQVASLLHGKNKMIQVKVNYFFLHFFLQIKSVEVSISSRRIHGPADQTGRGLTDGVGRQALRMASELECSGVYLGSCRMGCMLKGCLLFIDIMMAEVREGRCASSSFGSVLVL